MYESYYGLTGRPFQLTPDPAFYFESISHRKALSYLGYGLAQGEGFIVITGEVGAGKSTLVAHLMASIDRARLTAAQIVTSRLEGNELLHLAARSFGLETGGMDKPGVLRTIEDFLLNEARAGRRCLLVVDEAQNLSVDAVEELRMLSNFQLGSQALLQIFLLGQPEFRDVLTHEKRLEQLRQRVIASHHLEAMEPQEIEAYVTHRLVRVGWAGRPAFANGCWTSLYQATGGIPRNVNQLLSRVLLMGAVDQRDVIDPALIHLVLADMGGEQIEAVTETDMAEPVAEMASPAVEAAAEPEVEPVLTPAPAPVHLVEEPVAPEPVIEEPVAEAAEMAPEIAATPADSASAQELADLRQRVAELESALAAQDAEMRRSIAMLVRHFENDMQRATRSAAA